MGASWSHVAIIGHITPREFRRRLAEADLAAGTYNRYLPLYVERTRLLPIPARERGGDQTASAAGCAARPGPAVRRIQIDGDATSAMVRRAVPGTDRRRRRGPRVGRVHPPGRALLPAHSRSVRRARRSPAHRPGRPDRGWRARPVLDRVGPVRPRPQVRDPRLERIKREIAGAGEAGLTRTAISGLFFAQPHQGSPRRAVDPAHRGWRVRRGPAWPPRGDLQKRTGELFLLLLRPKGRPDDE